jgi:hypothetical protein
MCPVFKENIFRSKCRKEMDKVMLFVVDAHIWGPWSPELTLSFSYALVTHSVHCSFSQLCQIGRGMTHCSQFIQHTFFYVPSAVPGSVLGSTWEWVTDCLCLQRTQRFDWEAAKPSVLVSALPAVGPGDSGNMKGHWIEARAAGVGKES